MTAASVRVPARFNGPPGSANGGYMCGLVAGLLDAGPAEVMLRARPPLETDLPVERDGATVTVRDGGGELVATGRPAAVALELPDLPAPELAARAGRAGYERWSAAHPFPTCVVCGPAREPGDGLRIFPGPLREGHVYGAGWTPDASLADDRGSVRPECVWAALDCPTSAPIANFDDGPPVVLGTLAASIEGPVAAGEPHAIASWEIERDGRKRTAGAALYDSRGVVLARSQAIWIELRER